MLELLLALQLTAANALAVPAGSVATVLVFTTSDCPISNRYAPEIQRLSKRFGNVRFVLVYPAATDTPAVIDAHRKKFAYTIDAVRDSTQQLVKFTGVSVTPEVAVIDRNQRVVYRGRIDDRFIEFGKDRPQATERDLERALEAVVEHRPVAVRETRAVGCFLADLVK
jgi:thiol-disulfide isomerase/thioredoxin